MVILVGPPGSTSNDPVLPNSGFSYIFRLPASSPVKLADDLKDDSLGVRNVGQPLGTGGGGFETPAGELRGWLQPVVTTAKTTEYVFVADSHPVADTKGPARAGEVPFLVLWNARGDYFDPVGVYEGLTFPGWQQGTTPALRFVNGANGSDMQWQLVPDSAHPGWVRFVNVFSGTCADIYGGTVAGPVDGFPCRADADNQLWKLLPASQDRTGSPGTFELATKLKPDYVLTVTPEPDRDLGAHVTPNINAPTQRFQISGVAVFGLASTASPKAPVVVTAGDAGQTLSLQALSGSTLGGSSRLVGLPSPPVRLRRARAARATEAREAGPGGCARRRRIPRVSGGMRSRPPPATVRYSS